MKFWTEMTREERKRLFEAVAMVVTAGLLIGLSRLESRLFELSERLSQNQEFVSSTVYFGLINLILFVYNIIKYKS